MMRGLLIVLLPLVLVACGTPSAYKNWRAPDNTTYYSYYALNWDGSQVAFSFHHRASQGGGAAHRIAVYDRQGNLKHMIAPDSPYVGFTGAEFSPDGQKIVFSILCTGTDKCGSYPRGGSIGLFDVKTETTSIPSLPEDADVLMLPSSSAKGYRLFTNAVVVKKTDFTFSPDSKHLYYLTSNYRLGPFSGARDFRIRRHDFVTGEDVSVLNPGDKALFFGGGGTLLPNGPDRIIIWGGTPRVGILQKRRRDDFHAGIRTRHHLHYYDFKTGLSDSQLSLEELRAAKFYWGPGGALGSYGNEIFYFNSNSDIWLKDGDTIRPFVSLGEDKCSGSRNRASGNPAEKLLAGITYALSGNGRVMFLVDCKPDPTTMQVPYLLIDTRTGDQQRFALPNAWHALKQIKREKGAAFPPRPDLIPYPE